MVLFSFYFFAKLYLYYKGYISLHIFKNLFYAAFLAVPLPERFRYRPLAALKVILGIALGLLLLWHDSWLSSPFDALNFFKSQGMPSREYIYSFILGYLHLREAIALGSILLACVVLNRYLKMMPVVIILLLLVLPLQVSLHGFAHADTDKTDKTLEAFYDYESQRVVRFKKGEPDFDIVILQVCSLATDDLRETGLENNPFFRRFNLYFSNFNSATGYSGPAAIRLLKSNCGQPRHNDIYNESPRDCYLMESLAAKGYDTYFAMNHDGRYGNFAEEARRYGHIRAQPLKTAGAPQGLYMFDDSPIYDDYPVLERWWNQRMQSTAPAALFYNTVTLHDGAHWAGEKNWWKRDRKSQYTERITKLLDDMSRFSSLLESSGRNVVVVFVPEHGMGLRSSNMQGSGLRDIPLPQITNVPVGIRFFGPKFNGAPAKQMIISKPASYLAISHLLSEFISKSPFQTDEFTTRAFIDRIPQTDQVAENQGILVMKDGGKYYLFKDRKWVELPGDGL